MVKKELTESLEKYLLAIYYIVSENKAARIKDISTYLNIGGPATSDAVKILAKRGFINYVPYGIITITEKGNRCAEEKIYRHNTISNFLEKVLQVNPNEVQKSAKSIEYAMPEDVLNKFVSFLTFMEYCSCKEPKWIKSYKFYSTNKKMQEKCQNCINKAINSNNTGCCNDCCKQ